MKNLEVNFEIRNLLVDALDAKSTTLYNDLHRLRKLNEDGFICNSDYMSVSISLHEDIDLLVGILVRLNRAICYCMFSFCENEWSLLLGCLRDYRGRVLRSAEISSVELEKKLQIIVDLLECEF